MSFNIQVKHTYGLKCLNCTGGYLRTIPIFEIENLDFSNIEKIGVDFDCRYLGLHSFLNMAAF